jgi:DNA-binding PadR family transcriptional regulator
VAARAVVVAVGPGGLTQWASRRHAPSAIAGQPRHGYEIIQHIEQRAGGSYRPSPGVIYPTLQMLEELEHARVVEKDGRKVYAITDAGKAELETNRATVDEFYARFTEDHPWESYAEDFAELMKRVGQLMATFRKGAHRGRMSPATMRAIRQALDEALRKIDDVLNGSAR